MLDTAMNRIEASKTGEDAMHKILLVDDDDRIRNIYKMLLELEGFEVVDAGDWDTASEALLNCKDLDLVMLDIKMPGYSGDVIFDAVHLHNPKLRVIVSSIYPLEEQKRLILKADDYFDKSSGVDTLLKKVKRLAREPVRGG